MENAAKHGAAGVLYNYHLVNPNCSFIKGQIKVNIGKTVTDDILSGTGKTIQDLLKSIRDNRKPVSFNTRKIVTMKCRTEYHPDGIGSNVIAVIEGTDPLLKNEPVIIGAHLDHLGMSNKLMPGANDNASAVGVLYAVAEALVKVSLPFKRSIIFILFGAEEQGVKGSEFYLQHSNVATEKMKAFINLESVGRGENISAGSGKNYPKLYEVFEKANNKFVHRIISASFNSNIARPRQDAAHFLWANVPTISFGTYGALPLPISTYHTTYDKAEYLTPEIMEDLARIVFVATIELANE
jgi:Iap family predicted aminopeptidase